MIRCHVNSEFCEMRKGFRDSPSTLSEISGVGSWAQTTFNRRHLRFAPYRKAIWNMDVEASESIASSKTHERWVRVSTKCGLPMMRGMIMSG